MQKLSQTVPKLNTECLKIKYTFFKTISGMEGEADADKINEITAVELHSYAQPNVIQQSSGSKTPELQGDTDRVIVRFE